MIMHTAAAAKAPGLGEGLPVVSRWPQYEEDEIAAVRAVLRSGKVNALVHGEQTRRLEQEFAGYIGVPHAICLANGTVTLELALRAFGIGPGNEVIVPARSFFATASAVIAAGATPVFADVSLHDQNIDPASVVKMISERTRAIICVHLAGWPCRMAELRDICDRNGLFLVEDCAQAHGASIDGRMVGSFGDAASFSFCTDKIMSTGGEGGVLTFQDHGHWDFAWSYKDHGKDRSLLDCVPGRPGEFRYVHSHIGTNFRMTEMQAAIGRKQLAKLPRWLARRRANAWHLMQELRDHPLLDIPDIPAGVERAEYKFYVQLRYPEITDRFRVIAELQAEGIPCGTGSCPDMSREGAFAGIRVIRDGELPQAKELGERTIMFPVDHTLDRGDMDRIATALIGALD